EVVHGACSGCESLPPAQVAAFIITITRSNKLFWLLTARHPGRKAFALLSREVPGSGADQVAPAAHPHTAMETNGLWSTAAIISHDHPLDRWCAGQRGAWMVERQRSESRHARTSATRPPVRAEVEPQRRRIFLLFSSLLLGAGICASIGTAVWIPSVYSSDLLLIGPLLVIGFLLAEYLSINLDVKRVGWTISFSEIPLILGLLTAPFEVVLAANLLAGLGAQVGRRAGSHVPYNTAVLCLEIAIPFSVSHGVSQLTEQVAPHWFGPVVGTLTSSLLSCAFALGALHVLGGSM